MKVSGPGQHGAAAGPGPELWAVVGSQRAHRAFSQEPLEDALVEQLLWAATRAPSAENAQPWVFVVVREPACRAALGRLARRAWEGGGRARVQDHLPPALLADVDRGAKGGVAEAPVLVVVCADTAMVHPSTLGSSIFPAVQNLLLAATATGLGSALTTLPLVYAGQVCELLALPGGVEPQAVVPLGWPARRLGPPQRLPLSQVVHRETFGAPW